MGVNQRSQIEMTDAARPGDHEDTAGQSPVQATPGAVAAQRAGDAKPAAANSNARRVTLEGLSVSYYFRASKMYDLAPLAVTRSPSPGVLRSQKSVCCFPSSHRRRATRSAVKFWCFKRRLPFKRHVGTV